MDTRLLRHYENELAYLREMGAEFAEAFPKIASRLGMDGLEVLDPYVERLLEGTAFLSARVQLELELQYPHFTSHLLELIYPHYLAPTPSMMVAQLHPDMENAVLADGYTVSRGTALRSTPHSFLPFLIHYFFSCFCTSYFPFLVLLHFFLFYLYSQFSFFRST